MAQNWRTRWCEIDIIAQKADAIYMVEVKYRRSARWGSGLDYITPRKIKQMRFAADVWRSQHAADSQCFVAAVELTGEPPRVAAWLDSID